MKSAVKTIFITFTLLISALPSTSYQLAQNSEPDAVTSNLNVTIINQSGFGCHLNLYSWSMASFKNKVYVGLLNARGANLGLRVFVAGSRLMRLFTNGAQIHQGTKNETNGIWSWEEVVRNGLTHRSNFGVRKMITVGDYLYGVTANHNSGMEVWRTFDGVEWGRVSRKGFGTRRNTSGRGLAAFNGYLYVGTENRLEGSEIWRRAIDKNGDFVDDNNWERVVEKGFENNRRNIWVADFIVHDTGFGEYLYAGTFNFEGSQLWRTSDGLNWSNIYRVGNGIEQDVGIMKLYSYGGLLYVGTANVNEGASLLVSNDQEATDFLYVFVGGVKGNKRLTYVWEMIGYGGRLYVAYLHGGQREEFALYSSDNPQLPEFYEVETENSFGIANDTIGIRSMAIFNESLIMGTAGALVPAIVFEGIQR